MQTAASPERPSPFEGESSKERSYRRTQRVLGFLEDSYEYLSTVDEWAHTNIFSFFLSTTAVSRTTAVVLYILKFIRTSWLS